MIGDIVEHYVDDLVVKSHQNTWNTLGRIQQATQAQFANDPLKCVFGITQTNSWGS